MEEDQAIPKHLEKGFCLKVGKYSLRGVIDRVDDVGNGKIEIIDYQTGRPKDQGKLSLEDKEQLLIYQLAARAVLKEEPKALTFYYVDSGTKASFLGSDEDLEKLKAKVAKTAEGIREGRFEPKPSVMCKFCDYKNICEYRQA